jgi:cell division septation protein DedD
MEAAMKYVNRLINAGYDAYSIKYATADDNTLYRIRIGKYMTREDALQAANKIENDQGLPTWIIKY